MNCKHRLNSWAVAVSCAALICWFAHSSPNNATAGAPSGALAKFGKERTWTAKSGKFRIDASLAEATAAQVRLKQADGRVSVVPLDKLSDADQVFVQTFLEAEAALGGGGDGDENPFEVVERGQPGKGMRPPAGGQPADEEPEDGSKPGGSDDPNGFKPIPMRKFNTKSVATLSIDWEKEYWKGAPVAALNLPVADDSVTELPLKKDFFDGFQLRVAGVKPLVLVNVYRQGRGENENYTRLGGIRLPDGEPKLLSGSTTPWKIFAITPDAQKMAVVHIEGFDVGSNLALWNVTEDGVQADFQFQAGGGSFDEVTWAYLLPNDRMVSIAKKGALTFWNLAEKKAISRLMVSGITEAAVGGRGELIALPGPGRIAFLNGQTGRQVGLTILDTREQPSLAFSTDGQKLAAYTPHNVDIISLTDGKIINSIPIMNSQPRLKLDWLGNYVLLDSHLLLDVELGCPIWDYPSVHGSLGHAVWAGQLFTIFEGEPAKMVQVALPHPAAKNAADSFNPNDMYALQKGSSLNLTASLEGMAPADQEKAQSELKRRLTESGYRIEAGSPNTIHLELKKLPEVEEEFVITESRGPFGIGPPPGFGPRPQGPVEKVRYSPYQHTITITAGGKVVYKKEMHVAANDGLSLKSGENAQAAVNRVVAPNATFFASASLPNKILKPELQTGLGKTEIDRDGFK